MKEISPTCHANMTHGKYYPEHYEYQEELPKSSDLKYV